jgi:acyl-homoserine-lactone acylase
MVFYLILVFNFFGVDTLVENNYENKLSPEFRKVVDGYVQAVNDYALKHPEEVLVKSSFPFFWKRYYKKFMLESEY